MPNDDLPLTAAPAVEPIVVPPFLAPAPAPVSRFDAIVDLWFAECIQGGEVARITTAYNAVFAAKDDLKQRLAKEI